MQTPDEESQGTVWDNIISLLSADSMSISAIAKRLSERGTKLNRLFLTGYLEAMVRVGILNVKEIKPSKVYSMNPEKHFDIYELVGSICLQIDPENPADRVLETLYLLFNRPIFLREVEKCNVDIPENYKKANSVKRLEYIERLGKIGMKIPENNALLEPTGRDRNSTLAILIQLLKNKVDFDAYSPEDSEGIQKRLDEPED